MAPVLDEQSRRRFVALEAQTVGHYTISPCQKRTRRRTEK
jgi:hypothetical protein